MLKQLGLFTLTYETFCLKTNELTHEQSLAYSRIIKLLTGRCLEFLSLKVGFTGSSRSVLVRMPHCWRSHVAAHIVASCC